MTKKTLGYYRFVMVLRKWYIKLINHDGTSPGVLGPYEWKEITPKKLRYVNRLGYVKENEHDTQTVSSDSTNNRSNN